MSTLTQTIGVAEPARISAKSSESRIYFAGAAAALAIVIIAVVQAPLFILYPPPDTILGHFTQFRDSRLIGLLDLDLMLLLGQLTSIPVFFALYTAMRRVSPLGMTIAFGLGLAGIGMFFAVNPTFSMLYLSDQYWAATADTQRLALLSAGEALWANYNGTAFGAFFICTGLADLMFAFTMWRGGMFGKITAAIGMLTGAMLLVPPLPPLGAIPLAMSYLVILPSLLWHALIAHRLLMLSKE